MLKANLLPVLCTALLSPAFSQDEEDQAWFARLVSANYYELPYTAHVHLVKSKAEDKAKNSFPGYVSFEVTAKVIETFKGKEIETLTYYTTHEAPSDGPTVDREVVLSLEIDPESGSYYVPDNGYVFGAREPMLETLRKISFDTIKARISCRIPPPEKAINDAVLKATLFEHDPRIADAPAKEVDLVLKEDINLTPEEETSIDFSLSTVRRKDRAYYLTVFIHPDKDSNKRLYFIDGFQKVFEEANIEELDIKLSPTSHAP